MSRRRWCLATAILLAGACSPDHDAPPPPAVKRAFVTSVTYDGNLGGAAGADAKCAQRALAAGLGGTWKAWISTSGENAIDRVQGSGPWFSVDGTVRHFKDRQELAATGGFMQKDELGGAAGPLWYVWTGTRDGGTHSGTSCSSWTIATPGVYATVGSPLSVEQWTEAHTPYPCHGAARLYCFEQ